MSRKQPPEGYLTSAQAALILKCSVGMVYNYERSGQLHKETPRGRRQGFFKRDEVEALAEGLASFFESPVKGVVGEGKTNLVFCQATPDDMEGVYKVAVSLFGSTTSAEARKPLVAFCPEGNYVVKRARKVVAYIHIQPLKHERLLAFMRGEIRGKDIKVDDIRGFTLGEDVECLVKSIGAVNTIGDTDEARRANQLHFLFKLLRGTSLAIADLGSKGIKITKIYATSETVTGIAMGFSARMELFGKPLGLGRFRFVLDVATSDLPLLQLYKRAFAEWMRENSNTFD